MKVLIAPDSYKGVYSTIEVSNIIKEAIKKYNLLYNREIDYEMFPVSDGGEGFLEVFNFHKKGEIIKFETIDFEFDKIEAEVLYYRDEKIVVIESARVIGIHYKKVDERKPFYYSSKGIGILIKKVIENLDVEKIYIGLGGSTTVDLGLGILEGLEVVRFLWKFGEVTNITPIVWNKVEEIEIVKENIEKLPKIKIFCDVNNPLLGENGGLLIYAPQKGVKQEELSRLEKDASRIVRLVEKAFNKQGNYTKEKMGVAGGISWGFSMLEKSELIFGIDFILEKFNFREKLESSDILITGEGRTDFQSLFHKVIGKLAQEGKSLNKKVVVLSGAVDYTEDLLKDNVSIFSILNEPLSLEEAISKTKDNIINTMINLLILIDK